MDELPIACDRDALDLNEPKRQRELWVSLLADVEERRELEEGYALKLPAAPARGCGRAHGYRAALLRFLEATPRHRGFGDSYLVHAERAAGHQARARR